MRTAEDKHEGVRGLIDSRAANRWRGTGILVLRVGVALMTLSHGWPKLQLLLASRGGEWMDPLGWGAAVSLGLCV